MASPLVDGLVVMDPSQLELKMLDPSVTIKQYAAKVDAYSALVDSHSHMIDALRYGVMSGAAINHKPEEFPDPPAVPAGLTPDQIEAHCSLYELLTPDQFWAALNSPSVIRINKFWAMKGKRKFCCMSEQPVGAGFVHVGKDAKMPWWLEDEEPLHKGELGYVNGVHFFNSVQLNEAWMAKIEHSNDGITWTAVDPAKEKRPWWDRFLQWLANKVF